MKGILKFLYVCFFLNLVFFSIESPAASAESPFAIDTETDVVTKKYTVQKGDTLSEIGVQYNVSIQDLNRYNNLKNQQIFIGQRLLIPLKPKKKESIDDQKEASAKALIDQGDKFRTRQDYDKAKALYEEAHHIDPNNVDALFGLGYSNLRMQNYTEAIASFVKAVEVDPYNPRSHFNLGLVYTSLKEKKPAFEQYKILKTLDEKFATRLLMYIDSLR